MALATNAMIPASIQASQGIIHKIIKGGLHLTGIAKHLHSRARKLLLRPHPHPPGNNMCYFML